MVSKLLFSFVLAVSPIVSVSAQAEYTDFDTFQTAEKYLADFDYLTENSYRVSVAGITEISGYSGQPYKFYVFPIYYDIEFPSNYGVYHENSSYKVITRFNHYAESNVEIEVKNYIGSEIEFTFFALDYNGILQVSEHDRIQSENAVSIYNSFYNFFTGFFPNEVVAEYHGIFTFVIVAFLLFLVFGFVFFLFRVIRRLVGFK